MGNRRIVSHAIAKDLTDAPPEVIPRQLGLVSTPLDALVGAWLRNVPCFEDKRIADRG